MHKDFIDGSKASIEEFWKEVEEEKIDRSYKGLAYWVAMAKDVTKSTNFILEARYIRHESHYYRRPDGCYVTDYWNVVHGYRTDLDNRGAKLVGCEKHFNVTPDLFSRFDWHLLGSREELDKGILKQLEDRRKAAVKSRNRKEILLKKADELKKVVDEKLENAFIPEIEMGKAKNFFRSWNFKYTVLRIEAICRGNIGIDSLTTLQQVIEEAAEEVGAKVRHVTVFGYKHQELVLNIHLESLL